MAPQMSTSQAAPESRAGFDTPTKTALAITVLLLALRLVLSQAMGYGDSEALYASYALFKQATYLDHPGLIGWVGRWIADADGVPSPITAHRLTTAAALALPWIGGIAARAAGASSRGIMWTVVALAVTPELAVGLFAYTPDVLLGLCWVASLAAALDALRAEPRSTRSLGGTVAAFGLAALGTTAKVSGVLLLGALLLTWLSKGERERWRTSAPWAGVLCASLVTAPLVVREAGLGWPMLQHRLVATQAGFGPTLRNVGALIGGQLLYVTPFVLFGAVLVARDLVRTHRQDGAAGKLLLHATWLPAVVLSVLMVLSKVAEPHWLAPAYVALAIHLGLRVDREPPIVSRRLAITSVATSLAAIALVFAVVRYPVLPKVLGNRYVARYDLTNDLFAWQEGNRLVRDALQEARELGPEAVTVVGPHWVVCAQVQAGVGNGARVGCETDVGDDFQGWHPRSVWEGARTLLYVTDDRFEVDLRKRFPDRAIQSVSRVSVRRGGVVVRTIRVTRLGRMGSG